MVEENAEEAVSGVNHSIGRAFHRSVASEASSADAALIALASRYAAEIDNAEDQRTALKELGPRLLAALDALGVTPKSRAAIFGKQNTAPDSPAGALSAMRSQRRADVGD